MYGSICAWLSASTCLQHWSRDFKHSCQMTETISWGFFGRGFRYKAGYSNIVFVLKALAQDTRASLLALYKAENNLVCSTSKWKIKPRYITPSQAPWSWAGFFLQPKSNCRGGTDLTSLSDQYENPDESLSGSPSDAVSCRQGCAGGTPAPPHGTPDWGTHWTWSK